MALIDTYRSNVIRKREAISKLVSDKAIMIIVRV